MTPCAIQRPRPPADRRSGMGSGNSDAVYQATTQAMRHLRPPPPPRARLRVRSSNDKCLGFYTVSTTSNPGAAPHLWGGQTFMCGKGGAGSHGAKGGGVRSQTGQSSCENLRENCGRKWQVCRCSMQPAPYQCTGPLALCYSTTFLGLSQHCPQPNLQLQNKLGTPPPPRNADLLYVGTTRGQHKNAARK